MIELIIGRESGAEKPRLAIYQDGAQPVFMGMPGSVPKDVSRKHCKVSVGDDAKMLIEDITDNNFMYVNGVECKRKKDVLSTDTIELGPSKYHLDMEAVLKTLSSKQSFNISHLQTVFDNYQKEKMDQQVKQGKLNALSALPGVLSMTSIGLAVFIPNARIIMIVIAGIFALFFAYIRYKNATEVPLKTKMMDDKFRESYVCPNPMCNHFLGMTPYKELIKNRSCPYCKSKFTE